MPSLPDQIMKHADESQEGTLLCPSALLHLGSRAAVDQALSRLARRGQLMRICQGVYARPIKTRFGLRPPAVEKVIKSLEGLWYETIVPCGGAAENAFGPTTQVPVQSTYLTSGPNRRLKLGELTVHLRHAPRWQLVAPYRPAGDAVRALAWLGPEEIEENLSAIERKLSSKDFDELAEARAVMPSWIAESISARIGERMVRYPAVIDGERGAYGVVVHGIPGACVAMGDTVDEALADAEEALFEFVDMLIEEGKSVPPPPPVQQVRLKPGEMLAFVTLRYPIKKNQGRR